MSSESIQYSGVVIGEDFDGTENSPRGMESSGLPVRALSGEVRYQYPPNSRLLAMGSCGVISLALIVLSVVMVQRRDTALPLQTHKRSGDMATTAGFSIADLSHIQGNGCLTNNLAHQQQGVLVLYTDKSREDGSLFGRIPRAWLADEQAAVSPAFLLVDQITRGLGIRELMWDPGSVVAQDLVYFRLVAGEKKLACVSPIGSFRGLSGSSVSRSYAEGVLWSFDILLESQEGYIVNMTDFSLAPAGLGHSGDLSVALGQTFGLNYAIDKPRSSVNPYACSCSSRATAFEANLTYALQQPAAPGVSSPFSGGSKYASLSTGDDNSASYLLGQLPLSAYITVAHRRTILRLDDSSNEKVDDDGLSLSSDAYKYGVGYGGYRPRRYHPKSGFNSIMFMNDSAPIMKPRDVHFIVRHHLSSSRMPTMTMTTPEGNADAALPDQRRGIYSRESWEFEDKVSQQRSSLRNTKPPMNPNETEGEGDIHASVTTAAVMTVAAASTSSDPLQLLYLIDRKTPSPIREALVEGVGWWDQAFQYAGFPAGTFQARVAPDDFDPYNITSTAVHFVEWIDRDRRGYSLGIRIIDPRNGRILRGHARIESLRMRQDALIAEAVMGPFVFPNGSGNTRLEADVMDLVFKRVRQLGAHEVGHTLGLAHNYAGSTYGPGIASVMDYPPPIFTLDNNGDIVLNNRSYGDGIGYFDKIAIDYGYRIFATGTTAESRNGIKIKGNHASSSSLSSSSSSSKRLRVEASPPPTAPDVSSLSATATTGDSTLKHDNNTRSNQEKETLVDPASEWDLLLDLIATAEQDAGYVYLTDQDSGIAEGDWRSTPWDSGSDPIKALNISLIVRSKALDKLGLQALPEGAPLSNMDEVLPPLYLWHRYEVAAAAKLIGGYSFQYALRGDKVQQTVNPISGSAQRRALQQLIRSMDPEVLAIPDALKPLLLPNAFGYVAELGGSSDLLVSKAGAAFDALTAAEIAANLVVSSVFNPARLQRLAIQRHTNSSLPSLVEVLQQFSGRVVLLQKDDSISWGNATAELQSCSDLYWMYNNDYDHHNNNSNNYALERMAAQNTLVNKYAELVSSGSLGQGGGSTSAVVGAQISLHMDALAMKINAIVTLLNSCRVSGGTPRPEEEGKGGGYYCEDIDGFEWQAHYSKLLDALKTKRTFLVKLPTPLGSPI